MTFNTHISGELDAPPASTSEVALHITVLVAHCDPVISAGLEVLLQERPDFKVIVARANGHDLPANQYCAAVDVAVADYESALRLVRAEPGWRQRLLILTNSDSEARICHALSHGAGGYLLLGCGAHDLADAIRSVHKGGVAIDPLVAHRIAERMRYQALTEREETILEQMMLGWSNKKIALNLNLAVGTVKTHVKAILSKLGATCRTEAVAIAQRRGILR